MPRFQAVGERGSWFAEVNGERVPCVHEHWVTRNKNGMYYDDPGYSETGPKWPEFIRELKTLNRAVLTKDTFVPGGAFERQGYIALFDINNVRIENDHLRFNFVARIAELD